MKSISRVETIKESKKVEDTPVKRFEMEESERNYEKTEIEKMGYASKAESNKKIGEEKIVNKQMP
jgi:hypothetical protein